MSTSINEAIGRQLKQARVNKTWSLDITSEHTGVSKAMLGQIERGESSPTVARLWKIANGFRLPLSYFFGAVEGSILNQGILTTDKGMSITRLFPFDVVTKCEMFSLTLAPHYQQISQAHIVGVVEHIIVIEGAIEYLLDGEWHYLRQGEVIKFNADKEHGYRNMLDQPAVFHNIISYTNGGITDLNTSHI
ncbi:XRE family transcriptional regulator [Psychrosphaera aquimarina]|uniref:XRE family transcriptional regulator n=1 Tax=Psychrosphaera aquimarina TaxID=2044854 RepID=A0ABU3R3P4_9GAMM|nr:XRE family transcriptional regulator [Psychrosphaera aquimarina]MDU0114273.1 XRE family transcriptional regulator [Psychrosphaera aquimarina]